MPEARPQDASPIIPAQPEDLPALLTIMRQANDYAEQQSGNPMWTTKHAEAMLREQLELGNFFVVRDPDGTISAAIALDEVDPESWGDRGKDDSALYFHKLMKNTQSPLVNVGRTLLHFAAQEASRRHKAVIRCDTNPSMLGLIAYYQRFGFETHGTFVYSSSGLDGLLLEAYTQIVLEKTATLAE